MQWACSSALSGRGARGQERTRETTARQGVGTMQRSSLLLPVDVVRRTALPDRAHGRGHMGARLQNLCARGWPGHPSNFHFMQRLWGVPQRQELKKASKRSRPATSGDLFMSICCSSRVLTPFTVPLVRQLNNFIDEAVN